MNTFWRGLLKKKLFEAGPLRKSMRNSSGQKLVSSFGMKHETKHSRVNRVTADWSLDSQVSPGSPKVGKKSGTSTSDASGQKKIGCTNGCSMLHRYKNEYERITMDNQFIAISNVLSYTQYGWWNPQWCVVKSPWSPHWRIQHRLPGYYAASSCFFIWLLLGLLGPRPSSSHCEGYT